MSGLSGFGLVMGGGVKTFVERMSVARHAPGAGGPQAAQIVSKMQSILSGGAGAMFANPIAAVNSTLSAIVSNGATALTTALGGSAATLVAAMTGAGGLTSALSNLQTMASAMSGASSPGVGAYGLSDVMSHASMLTQFFGSTSPEPSSVSLSTVLAPLDPAPLSDMADQAAAIIAGVIDGTIAVNDGVALISGLTAQVNDVMSAANAAILCLQTGAPAMQQALTIAAMAGSFDANMQAIAASITNPNLAALASAVAAIFAPTAEEQASMTSFPNSDGSGASGGQ